MLNCVAIDDDKLARNLLQGYIEKTPMLAFKGVFHNPLDILPLLESNAIDLIFIDIQMPDISGIDFIKSMDIKPAVVLTTAYSQYAVESYELDVADYLLKPFSFDRFLKAVQKVQSLAVQTGIPTTLVENTITLAADHKLYKVNLNDLVYIEGMREYVRYHFTSGKKITVLQSMKSLEESLPQSQFMRIHKSYIISISKATILEGNLIHIGEEKLAVGKTYREQVQALFK
jgi:DNA-binding LytR/AlgR family response regulator